MTWKGLGFSPEILNSYMLLNFDNGNKNKVVCLQNEDKAPSASWCHLSLHSNGQASECSSVLQKYPLPRMAGMYSVLNTEVIPIINVFKI